MAAKPGGPAGLVQCLHEPVILLDADDRVVVAVSESFVAQWAANDVRAGDLTGRRVDDLAELVDDTLIDHLRRANTGTHLQLQGVTIWRPREPEGRAADLTLSPIDGSSWVLVTLEPSDPTSLEEAHERRARRMAILGSCAAGFAHDINNQLSAVLSVTSLLREELSDEHHHVLDILEGSTREAASHARHLLLFSGRGEPEIGADTMDQIVERASMLVKYEMPPPERFSVESADAIPTIRGDVVQLEQLAATLLMIAAEALTEGGRGKLRVDKGGAGDAPRVTLRLNVDRAIDATDALEVVRRIADHHGGAMSVTDADGMQVDVYLPVDALLDERAAISQTDATSTSAAAGRVVLVVDDETMVRDVAVAMVERLGYGAIAASGGLEAIELLGREGLTVDLVLLDMVMKDLDGLAALRRIREVCPDVKVVLSSGFGEPSAIESEVAIDGTLEKPYSMATLKETLERVLG